ncbi:MAG: thiol-disulfide oxidoreductase DCC family protein [Gemmatimonadaceae bacterium]
MTARAIPQETHPVVVFTVRGQTSASECPTCDYTVVYDGMCKVCTRLANLLQKWDRPRKLEVVSSQTPGVMARFPWIPPRAFAEALQMVATDGTTWSGAAAIERLLDVLPKGKLISWIFKIPFVRRFADKFYRWFAKNRYRLGCGEHCMTRPPDVMFREAEEG